MNFVNIYLFLTQPNKVYHPSHILIYCQYNTLQNPLYVEKFQSTTFIDVQTNCSSILTIHQGLINSGELNKSYN